MDKWQAFQRCLVLIVDSACHAAIVRRAKNQPTSIPISLRPSGERFCLRLSVFLVAWRKKLTNTLSFQSKGLCDVHCNIANRLPRARRPDMKDPQERGQLFDIEKRLRRTGPIAGRVAGLLQYDVCRHDDVACSRVGASLNKGST